MKSASFPSWEEFKKMEEEITSQDSVLRRADNFQKLYDEIFDDHSLGFYPYIPMRDKVGLYEVFCIAKTSRYSLLDIGAGTGRIVALAKMCGIPAAGLEYQELYVEAGRKLFGLSEEELFVGDAFEISPDILSEFSLIYTYMPISNRGKMTDLHFSLYQKAAPGTKFVEMLPSYYPMNSMKIPPQNHHETFEYDFVMVEKRDYNY